MKKIYIASSWRNQSILLLLARLLRRDNFEVDCFCEEDNPDRYTFNIKDCVVGPSEIDAKEALEHWQFQKAFQQDKEMLDWCDICIMVLPCGNSSHIEAGYAKGAGKRLYIYGEFEKGKWDVMYGFADGMFRIDEVDELICELKDVLT